MGENGERPLVLLHLGWPRDRELVGGLLDAAGVDSRPTPESSELRRLLTEGRLDLVLADTKGGRGPLDDVLATLDACSEAGDLPLVLLAEADEVSGLADLVRGRPNAVLLAKPVDPGQLRAAVEAGLRYRAGRRRERELVRQLTEANASLREADRRKDEFLATLAHELRNPLAPIRNAVQILKAKGPPDPDLAWSRDVIERQVAPDGPAARRPAGRLPHHPRQAGASPAASGTLAAVVEAAVETSRPLIEGGGHELTIALPPEPVYLDADPVRLAQVFANLLNNAAKYTDRGAASG